MLLPSLKNTFWFVNLNFINGLVAPAFLFISGFAFILSTQNKTDELRKFGHSFRKKLGRIILIFLAGYSLHLPILSLRRIIDFYSPGVIERIYNVDILQCIAAGLLILFVARIIIKSDYAFNIFTIILLIISVLLAPIVHQFNFGKYLPLPFAAYFNSMYGSLFPLFPWVGFLFAGTIASKYFLEAHKNYTSKKYIKSIFSIGTIAAVLGYLFSLDSVSTFIKFPQTNPVFFLQRLGYVLILLSLCWYYIEKRKTKSSFVLDVSKESLLVYWLHIEILYRAFWNNKSIADILGGKYHPLACIAATIILALIMILTAKKWGALKHNYKPYVPKFTFVFVTLLVTIFLIGF